MKPVAPDTFMTTLLDEFAWRGMVFDATEGLADVLARERVTAYIGFDPTASSLHVGSLLTVMGLARLQRFGHAPIAIVGGGTGMIGDPSGKAQERTLLTLDRDYTDDRRFPPAESPGVIVFSAPDERWLRRLLAEADRTVFRAESAAPRPLEGRKVVWPIDRVTRDDCR